MLVLRLTLMLAFLPASFLRTSLTVPLGLHEDDAGREMKFLDSYGKVLGL